MPPWFACVAIVLFCLGMNGFLFIHEVWPRISPGQPPLFTIDLADEAGNVRPSVVWKVYVNGAESFQLRTGIDLIGDQEDEFVLWAEYRPVKIGTVKKDTFGIRLIRGEFKVLRDGDLLSAGARVHLDSFRGVEFPFTLRMEGEIAKGLFEPWVSTETPQGERKVKLDPMVAPANGVVFQPFQPVHRMLRLYPGRTWKQPFFDPLAITLSSTLTGGAGENGLGTVVARVRGATEGMQWSGKPVDCHVIDYSAPDLEASVWVGVRNGAVLRQKLIFADGMEWDILRTN